jgi:sugar (pentulose or hexulose) kinase
MSLVLGVDIGTTTITALALDPATGEIAAWATTANTVEITSAADKARGRSEWDIRLMADRTCSCLRRVAQALGQRRSELAGIGITGQQHGGVIVDEQLTPLTPFVNWQDRRGDELFPRSKETYVERAQYHLGREAPKRCGCRIATGYLGLTLFWMRDKGVLPAAGTACFAMDYFAALLTGGRPVTDPTCAASSGLFNVQEDRWDPDLLAALHLLPTMLPEVRTSGDRLGELTPDMEAATDLPAGLPVFVGIGDNQASFLGSVASRDDSVLVNVGTGGQVGVFTEQFLYRPELETRPFPRGGFLLVCAGLTGGRVYAVLEKFFRQVAEQLFGIESAEAIYPVMNQLAALVPRGAQGLRCEPYFTGTRQHPEVRASFAGLSVENFTPAHMTRALLEGMARAFRTGGETIREAAARPCVRLVGAGNGLRENPVLARIIADEFGLPMQFPRHREEAAYGAALLAAVGAGLVPDLPTAGRVIRYE